MRMECVIFVFMMPPYWRGIMTASEW
jgi:hypothetical protein